MSVGASSIKRAAKTAAADAPKETGMEAAEGRDGEKESGTDKNVKKKALGRSPAKASAPKAGKKQEPKAAQEAAAANQAAPAVKGAAGRDRQETYGIGQQLPVHLL